ncbi:MAG: response regulator [Gammaproteobacteria bacterium]|nr:response regulator [Gammaproteobacteria bacterium]
MLIEAQKGELVGNLSAGIAHDFNNILAIIAGHAKIASEEIPAGNVELADSVSETQKACGRAGELVNQILSFARRREIALKPTELTNIVRESERFLRAVLPARVSLDVACQSNLPCVLADGTLIEQVILNLAKNATDAAGGAPVHIGIRLESPSPAELLAAETAGLAAEMACASTRMVRLAVTDDGPGIDPAILSHIFDPFFTTKAAGSGTGLGLSVVKAIMHMHHGDIIVHSRPGAGTTFSAYLPIEEALETTGQAHEVGPLGAEANIGRGRHVIYLDDEESLVLLVCNMLKNQGYSARGYSRAEDAIAALRDSATPIDAFVTDFNMPVLSGLDVAREVRAVNASVPVLLASGFVEPGLRERAAGAGICRILAKSSIVDFGAEIELALAEH